MPTLLRSDLDGCAKSSRLVNFVVTGPGRTGSQLLLSALKQHSQIHCLGEIFLPKHYRETYLPGGRLRARDILDSWRGPAEKHVFGFSALYPELFRLEYSTDLIDELIAQRFMVVHVTRNNLLRRFLSHKIARRTGVWGDHEGKNPTTLNVHIGRRELLSNIRTIEKRAGLVKLKLRDLPLLDISYEAMCVDFTGTLLRVCDFLGAAREDLTPKTFKQESRSLRASITNYNRLKLLLTFSKYRRFFDD